VASVSVDYAFECFRSSHVILCLILRNVCVVNSVALLPFLNSGAKGELARAPPVAQRRSPPTSVRGIVDATFGKHASIRDFAPPIGQPPSSDVCRSNPGPHRPAFAGKRRTSPAVQWAGQCRCARESAVHEPRRLRIRARLTNAGLAGRDASKLSSRNPSVFAPPQ